jgi:hypothetical protein
MRHYKLKIPFSIFGLLLLSNLSAQQISQIGLSNYGKVHSLYINPSFTACSKLRWQVNVAGFSVNANNNYLSMHLPYSIYRIPNRIPLAYQTESGNPRFDKSWVHEHLNGRTKHLSVSSEVYGPAFSANYKSWTFGVFTQAAAGVRLVKLPENLAHALFNELDSSKGAYSLFNSYAQGGLNKFNAFSSTANSRINLGLNMAKKIQLDFDRQLLIGVNIKKVWGLPGYYLSADAMQAQTLSADSVLFSPTKIKLFDYSNQRGNGWGTDIGLTYVYHKKDIHRNGVYAENKSNYFAKFGLSILDIGRIKYQDVEVTSLVLSQTTGINLNSSFGNSVGQSGDYLAMADSFLNQFGSVQKSRENVLVGLPTRMVACADFQIKEKIYVAGMVSQSLRKRNSIAAHNQSFVMLSPRYESRYFEFSLPALLEYDYRSVRLGASMRFGPFFIGSNSLVSFVNSKGLRDADLFAGIAFGNSLPWKKGAKSKGRKQRVFKEKGACGGF